MRSDGSFFLSPEFAQRKPRPMANTAKEQRKQTLKCKTGNLMAQSGRFDARLSKATAQDNQKWSVKDGAGGRT